MQIKRRVDDDASAVPVPSSFTLEISSRAISDRLYPAATVGWPRFRAALSAALTWESRTQQPRNRPRRLFPPHMGRNPRLDPAGLGRRGGPFADPDRPRAAEHGHGSAGAARACGCDAVLAGFAAACAPAQARARTAPGYPAGT